MKETVNFHGKEYETVGSRVYRFREDHPDWGIVTSIFDVNDTSVIVQASVTDETGRVIGMGHDEERRTNTGVNKNNAVENAETSAIGRALAACGYAGTEYASADEMANTGVVAEHEAILRGCDTLEELSEAWKGVYSATSSNDRAVLVGIKDEMKAKLS